MRPARRYAVVSRTVGAACLFAALPGDAHAHAFGARYDLPLPLWLYLAAAGAAVLLSFLVMAAFLKPASLAEEPDDNEDAALGAAWLVPGRIASIALLLVIVIAAFRGDDSPTSNFATVFVWVVWWVGFVFVQALVVDLWSVLNPWRVLSDWAQPLLPAAWRDGRAPYPAALGHWPALAGFIVFAWLEMVSDLGEQPRMLGLLIVGYSVLTLTGAAVFGPRTWFASADPFAVVLGVFGRFAPIALGPGRVRLRVPGTGLIARQPVAASQVALVTALLASVSFDGFVETPAWAAILDGVSETEALRAPLLALQAGGMDLLKLVKTVGLLLAVALFAGVFSLFAALIDRCSGEGLGLRVNAGAYVLTLVPIAIGYHVAHYLSYLLIAGQLVIPLASDPFALGWDLFGTRGHAIDIAIVDARFVWYTAVSCIVAGHVISVYLAHVTALRLTGDRARAIRSQIPMLVLMVGYTMTSLWILSQPIVET